MSSGNFMPRIDLFGRIEREKFNSITPIPSNLSSIEQPETVNFKQVFSNVVENLNKETNAPDQMLSEVMSGNSSYDIHDVMIALSKADLGINIATTVTTKVLQSYEKITQIQL